MGRVRRFLINNVPTHCCPHGGHCQWCHLGLGTAPNRGPCSRTSCPSTAWASFGVKKPGRCRPWCVRGSERGVQGSRCCRCVVAGAPGWAAVSSAQILPLPAGPFRARAGFCWKPAEPASPAASLGLWLGAGPAPGPRGGGDTGDRTRAWRHRGRCLCQLARQELLPSPRCPHAVPTPQTAAAHGEPWTAAGTQVVADLWHPVMGRQWEPGGDSERLCWVAAGSGLAQRMSHRPGEGGALVAPRLASLGPVAHAMSPVAIQGACQH